MNEDELATYYEQHKDDPDVWEPVDQGPATPKEGLGATITVRFTAPEAATIRALAKRRHMTYSQLIRTALNEMLTPTVDLHVSVATTFVYSEPPAPTVTTEFTYLNTQYAPENQTGTVAFAR